MIRPYRHLPTRVVRRRYRALLRHARRWENIGAPSTACNIRNEAERYAAELDARDYRTGR